MIILLYCTVNDLHRPWNHPSTKIEWDNEFDNINQQEKIGHFAAQTQFIVPTELKLFFHIKKEASYCMILFYLFGGMFGFFVDFRFVT